MKQARANNNSGNNKVNSSQERGRGNQRGNF